MAKTIRCQQCDTPYLNTPALKKSHMASPAHRIGIEKAK